MGQLLAWVVFCLMCPAIVLASDAQLVTWDTLNPEITASSNMLSTRPAPRGATNINQPQALSSDAGNFDPLAAQPSANVALTASNYATSAAVLDKQVLIDGYVLPLAWDDTRVVDFLLVPWVGACIHMPTPAPNQIVHVTVPEGIVLEKQFEAVRLEGILKNSQTEHDLFLVDGQRKIPVAYALEDAAINGSPAEVVAMSADDLPVLARLQIWINAFFTESMQAVADDNTSKALIFALLVSFGYGALHTLGPGHGKSVVISYFIGSGGSLRRGLSMGIQIAIVHVLSAVVIVALLDLAVRQFTGAAPADFRAIRLGSYAMIIVIGSIMLWHAMSAFFANRREDTTLQNSHAHAHSHRHVSHSGCSACAAAANKKNGRWIAASVGIVPCTGALLVMLFGLANDMIWPAILMVVAISAGMALSMAAIGVVALYGRRIAERRLSGRIGDGTGFDIGARIIGSSCVLAIGILLFVLTMSYPPVMQTPIIDPAERHAENTLLSD